MVKPATPKPAPKPIDCRSDESITIGIINSIITAVKVLSGRDMSSPGVIKALTDLRSDKDVAALITDVSPLWLAAQALRSRVNNVVTAHDHEIEEHDSWHDLAREWLGGQAGEFCATMSPDVALALADVLEGIAEFNERTPGAKAGPQVLALARAVLQVDQS